MSLRGLGFEPLVTLRLSRSGRSIHDPRHRAVRRIAPPVEI